ncbi:MAG: CDP-glycerol glycerophosphotransferase family protein [Eubacterium sp.]
MIKKCLVALMRRLPLQKAIVLESHPDLSDNTYAVYEELLRRGYQKKYRIYWMKTFPGKTDWDLPKGVSYFENQPSRFLDTLKRAYVLNTSRYIIDCNSFVKKRRKGQVSFHLGHGMPIKIDLEYSRNFGECDRYMVQSPFWYDIFEKQILVPKEVLCPLGYPRNDVLVNKKSLLKWSKKKEKYKKSVIWMPTYRQHRAHADKALHVDYPYGMPCIKNKEQLMQLEEQLAKLDILLLFRPHPVQDLTAFQKEELPHIIIADDAFLASIECTLYELLSQTDALITDYSSVYFDYLLTDQPIALIIEDCTQYFAHFTLAFEDYKEAVKGVYIEKFEELSLFLTEIAEDRDSAREERMLAKKKYHIENAGKSAEAIVNLLEKSYHLR